MDITGGHAKESISNIESSFCLGRMVIFLYEIIKILVIFKKWDIRIYLHFKTDGFEAYILLNSDFNIFCCLQINVWLITLMLGRKTRLTSWTLINIWKDVSPVFRDHIENCWWKTWCDDIVFLHLGWDLKG